ncbi:MAG: uroporphyrinogen-III synthase, partial [Anaerolineales bacterium]|nr:uroporphyrinogen-III synthase [Anaerolineales bacterium]
FTSPSSVRNFLKLAVSPHLTPVLDAAVIACIGPVTAEEAAKFNLRVDLVPDEYAIEGLVQTLQKHFGIRD